MSEIGTLSRGTSLNGLSTLRGGHMQSPARANESSAASGPIYKPQWTVLYVDASAYRFQIIAVPVLEPVLDAATQCCPRVVVQPVPDFDTDSFGAHGGAGCGVVSLSRARYRELRVLCAYGCMLHSMARGLCTHC